jgi:hypothetical protein
MTTWNCVFGLLTISEIYTEARTGILGKNAWNLLKGWTTRKKNIFYLHWKVTLCCKNIFYMYWQFEHCCKNLSTYIERLVIVVKTFYVHKDNNNNNNNNNNNLFTYWLGSSMASYSNTTNMQERSQPHAIYVKEDLKREY